MYKNWTWKNSEKSCPWRFLEFELSWCTYYKYLKMKKYSKHFFSFIVYYLNLFKWFFTKIIKIDKQLFDHLLSMVKFWFLANLIWMSFVSHFYAALTFCHWKLTITTFISQYNKKILSKKIKWFLLLFRFSGKTFDIFYPRLWILESMHPRDRAKIFIESKVQPFCLLEQISFSMYLCVSKQIGCK